MVWAWAGLDVAVLHVCCVQRSARVCGAVCWCVVSMGGERVGVEWDRRRVEQMAMRELDGGMERVVVADWRDVVLVVCGIYVWHGCCAAAHCSGERCETVVVS